MDYNQQITRQDLQQLEAMLDEVYEHLGIDVVFSRHFIDRALDARNSKPFTIQELQSLFVKAQREYGHKWEDNAGVKAVLHGINSNISIPFSLQWNDHAAADESPLELVAITTIRKKNGVMARKGQTVFSVNEDYRNVFETGSNSIHAGSIPTHGIDIDEYLYSTRWSVADEVVWGDTMYCIFQDEEDWMIIDKDAELIAIESQISSSGQDINQIDETGVTNDYQGKGIAYEFYLWYIQNVGTLMGGSSHSVGARKMWARLVATPGVTAWVESGGKKHHVEYDPETGDLEGFVEPYGTEQEKMDISQASQSELRDMKKDGASNYDYNGRGIDWSKERDDWEESKKSRIVIMWTGVNESLNEISGNTIEKNSYTAKASRYVRDMEDSPEDYRKHGNLTKDIEVWEQSWESSNPTIYLIFRHPSGKQYDRVIADFDINVDSLPDTQETVYQTNYSQLAFTFAGQQIGLKLYMYMLNKMGWTLMSGDTQSGGAKKTWQRIIAHPKTRAWTYDDTMEQDKDGNWIYDRHEVYFDKETGEVEGFIDPYEPADNSDGRDVDDELEAMDTQIEELFAPKYEELEAAHHNSTKMTYDGYIRRYRKIERAEEKVRKQTTLQIAQKHEIEGHAAKESANALIYVSWFQKTNESYAFVKENGRISDFVQTDDVERQEISDQTAKFGNNVDQDGYPPLMNGEVQKRMVTAIEYSEKQHDDYVNVQESKQLNELFNNTYELNVLRRSSDNWQSFFDTDGGDRITVVAAQIDAEDDEWAFEFNRNWGDVGITGGGDAMRIFGTVMEFANEFVSTVKPKHITFHADIPEDGSQSRASLYRRLIKKFGSKMGYWHVEEQGRGQDWDEHVAFTLTRKDLFNESTINDIGKLRWMSQGPDSVKDDLKTADPIGKLGGYLLLSDTISGDGEVYYLIDKKGKNGLTMAGRFDITPDNNVWITNSSFVDPHYQGKGLGAKVYLYLMQKKGYTLQADRGQSEGAIKMWSKLVQTPGVTAWVENEDGEKQHIHFDDGEMVGLINPHQNDMEWQKWYDDKHRYASSPADQADHNDEMNGEIEAQRARMHMMWTGVDESYDFMREGSKKDLANFLKNYNKPEGQAAGKRWMKSTSPAKLKKGVLQKAIDAAGVRPKKVKETERNDITPGSQDTTEVAGSEVEKYKILTTFEARGDTFELRVAPSGTEFVIVDTIDETDQHQVGWITTYANDGHYRIEDTRIADDFIGMGLGYMAYMYIIKNIASTLEAGGSHSAGATKLWKKIVTTPGVTPWVESMDGEKTHIEYDPETDDFEGPEEVYGEFSDNHEIDTDDDDIWDQEYHANDTAYYGSLKVMWTGVNESYDFIRETEQNQLAKWDGKVDSMNDEQVAAFNIPITKFKKNGKSFTVAAREDHNGDKMSISIFDTTEKGHYHSRVGLIMLYLGHDFAMISDTSTAPKYRGYGLAYTVYMDLIKNHHDFIGVLQAGGSQSAGATKLWKKIVATPGVKSWIYDVNTKTNSHVEYDKETDDFEGPTEMYGKAHIADLPQHHDQMAQTHGENSRTADDYEDEYKANHDAMNGRLRVMWAGVNESLTESLILEYKNTLGIDLSKYGSWVHPVQNIALPVERQQHSKAIMTWAATTEPKDMDYYLDDAYNTAFQDGWVRLVHEGGQLSAEGTFPAIKTAFRGVLSGITDHFPEIVMDIVYYNNEGNDFSVRFDTDEPIGKHNMRKFLRKGKPPIYDANKGVDVYEDDDTLEPPEIKVGDEIKTGKWKNKKATVKGFKKDDKGHPILKTNKGDQQLYKPRVTKLLPEQQLNELFDKPLQWKWIIQDDDTQRAEFATPNGEPIQVDMQYHDNGTLHDTWIIGFMDKNQSHDATGTGEEFAVFSTVLDVIKVFINNKNPRAMKFGAATPNAGPTRNKSREKLYNRLVSKFSEKLGYKAHIKTDYTQTQYMLVKESDYKDVFNGR